MLYICIADKSEAHRFPHQTTPSIQWEAVVQRIKEATIKQAIQ